MNPLKWLTMLLFGCGVIWLSGCENPEVQETSSAPDEQGNLCFHQQIRPQWFALSQERFLRFWADQQLCDDGQGDVTTRSALQTQLFQSAEDSNPVALTIEYSEQLVTPNIRADVDEEDADRILIFQHEVDEENRTFINYQTARALEDRIQLSPEQSIQNEVNPVFTAVSLEDNLMVLISAKFDPLTLNTRIQGQFYNENGTSVGGPFTVMSPFSDLEVISFAAESRENGGFVVVMALRDTVEQRYRIYLRAFDEDGEPFAQPYLLPSNLPAPPRGHDAEPLFASSLTQRGDGYLLANLKTISGDEFVVAWYDYDHVRPTRGELRVQRFSDEGDPLFPDLTLDTRVVPFSLNAPGLLVTHNQIWVAWESLEPSRSELRLIPLRRDLSRTQSFERYPLAENRMGFAPMFLMLSNQQILLQWTETDVPQKSQDLSIQDTDLSWTIFQ